MRRRRQRLTSHAGHTSIKWAVVLAVGAAFAACPGAKPPGPSQRVLSDRVSLSTSAGRGNAWVLARRVTSRSKPQGRGSLPGCTLTTHSVEHFLVVQVGQQTRRVQFHVLHSGDTTKLPRYEVKPGTDGRCIALRPQGTDAAKPVAWQVVRVGDDGKWVHLSGDTVAPKAGQAPCDTAGSLRDAYKRGLERRKTIQYLDKQQLTRYLLNHPDDAELHALFVSALVQHPLALQAIHLPKADLPRLQARICSRIALVRRLRRYLAAVGTSDSYGLRNAVIFVERCRDREALRILCGILEKTTTRHTYFLTPGLSRLAGDLKGAPADCVPHLSRFLTHTATQSTERARLVWALAATNDAPARVALRRFAASSAGEPVQWPASYDALDQRLSRMSGRRADDYARALAAAWMRKTASGPGPRPRAPAPPPSGKPPLPRKGM